MDRVCFPFSDCNEGVPNRDMDFLDFWVAVCQDLELHGFTKRRSLGSKVLVLGIKQETASSHR